MMGTASQSNKMLTFIVIFCILLGFQPLSHASSNYLLGLANQRRIMEWEFLLRPAVTCLYKELSLTPPLGGSFQYYTDEYRHAGYQKNYLKHKNYVTFIV